MIGLWLQEGKLPALDLLHINFEATDATREEVEEGGKLFLVE